MSHMHSHQLPHEGHQNLFQANAIELLTANCGNAVASNLRCTQVPEKHFLNGTVKFYPFKLLPNSCQ